MKDFSLIVAIDLDGAIGHSKTNDIPWHLPGDFKHFKEKTTGKTVVMGSRTWASLPKRPLPNRRNIVLSQQRRIFEGANDVYPSLEEAIEKEDNVMIIGGAFVYEAAMALGPKTLHITIVDTRSGGDVKFPIEGRWMSMYDEFGYECERGTLVYSITKREQFIENNLNFEITEWSREWL